MCVARAKDIIALASPKNLRSGPLPLYLLFDGTYIARSIDVASKHIFFDGAHRLVGLKCSDSEWREDALSNARLETARTVIQSSLKRAEQGGEANLFKRIDLAPEIFIVYIQSAVGPRDEPCLPILTMAKETQIGARAQILERAQIVNTAGECNSEHCRV